MKIKTKRNYLLWFLLSTFLIIWIINVTIGEKTIIDTEPDISKLHTISLRSLFLGSGDFDTWFSWMRVNTWWSSLDLLNGLIVWKNNSARQWVEMVAIGGWSGNSVENSNAGIAWWRNNNVSSENWAIGGWAANYLEIWVVAGGWNNSITDIFGVILWWRRNNSSGGVILWWIKNRAWKYALALWSGARWEDGAFAWNGYAWQNSARINASGWMLIGTNTPVSWVYLVVDWSVKLWSGKFDSTTWWVWVNENGCIKASDGDSVYTLGRSSSSELKCGVFSGCQFGTTILHNGDKVTAYTVSYAKKCEDIAQTVTCKEWKFYNSGGSIMNVVYPYCYDLSPDPILTLTWWIKQCSWILPANTIPVNEYFKQNLQNGEWTPPNKSRSYYYNDVNKECSYKCRENYTWDGTSCVSKTSSCGWTKPIWSGYKLGAGTYQYGYTPTSWTYTGGTLWPCLYKCDTGYIWSGGKCVEPVYQCTWLAPDNATLVAWSDNWLTANTERKLYASAAEANWKKCAYLCDDSNYRFYDSGRCKRITSFCNETEVYKCESPATATNTWYSNGKYTWDCKIDWISEPVKKWCFRCKDGYTWNGSKCENEQKYKICYMWSNKYRVADNEPLPFLLDITVRCGIWVWEVFNKTYTINTWESISTWWLPNRSCEIINAQYEPTFAPEDGVEYIWTCVWSCVGCPSGMVENGGTCVSYNISSSCDKYEWCAQWKIISKCTDGQRDYEPWEFLTCGEYTWSEKVCVWSWTQYNTYYQDRNQSYVGCEHFHPSTQEWMYVGMDCSKICVLDSVGNCVVDNNIVDNLKYCCNCQKVNICSLEIPRCANYGELKNRCKNRYSRSFLHPEYPWWAS